jgi:phage shock protein A
MTSGTEQKRMTDGSGPASALEAAIHRLDQAVAQLELRLGALATKAEGANVGLFEQDRARLAADLDASRGRERELESAGLQASAALGRAIADIRAALGEDPDDEEPDSPSHSQAAEA